MVSDVWNRIDWVFNSMDEAMLKLSTFTVININDNDGGNYFCVLHFF